MSKEISKHLAKCPFCGEELELHCTGRFYMHKTNDCILQHLCFEVGNEVYIERWNTRKPLERIVERLQETKTKSYVTGITANPYEFGACHAMNDAIKIVKEEGGMNEIM